MKPTLLVISLVALCSLRLAAETAYFVVSYPPCHGAYSGQETTNAYILPLSQPADIEKARLLAATGGCFSQDGAADPVFTLGLGSDGTNRNAALPSQPLWSWHVIKLVAWTGYTLPEYLYTHPWEIERDVLNGTLTNGTQVTLKGIYTAIAEVNPPLALYIYPFDTEFFLYWTHDSPNTTYTVEWTQSLASPQWQPLDLSTPGVRQESSKMISIQAGAIDGGFFRLRADP